jgi:hypothetical protein
MKNCEQDESDGDLEFIIINGLKGKINKLLNVKDNTMLKMDRRMQGLKNSISQSDVGQTNVENRGKACGAHVVSTIRSGMTIPMD